MKEFRPAIFFLVRFVGIYLTLNVLYGVGIEYYNPMPDPLTVAVTNQSAIVISLLDDPVQTKIDQNQPAISILNNGREVISVFEGCNGVNVMIVFVAFLIAYRGSRLYRLIGFCLMGLLLIYFFNLIRVILLYEVSEHYEKYFYYFHKYILTGMLYALVMFLWFIWVKKSNLKPTSAEKE